MAEVPEVEIIVRDLREAMVGRTIHTSEVLQPAAVRYPTVEEFSGSLMDRTILDAQRRAKYILLPLSGELLLTVHLKHSADTPPLAAREEALSPLD
jgi:formamidopyrimidine-DNA glycosylase